MMCIDGLKTPIFVLPPSEIIQLFEKIVSPIFDIMENNVQESSVMAKTRDDLLPKLMSGEFNIGTEESG